MTAPVAPNARGPARDGRKGTGPTLFLHIGLPKTATTFLQTGVFPHLSGPIVHVMPTSARFATPEDAEDGHRLMTCALRRSAVIWRDWGEVLLAEMLGPRGEWTPRDVLVSDEGIGRTGSRPALLREHLAGIAGAAERWGFAETRILCVFRRQDHWFASHYAQVSDRNPAASQDDFESAARGLLCPFRTRYRLGMLMDYGTLRDVLVDAVGEERILMMPFERLATAPDGFTRDLHAFLRVPPPAEGTAGGARADRNVRTRGEDSWAIRPVHRAGGRGERLLTLPLRLAAPRREETFMLTPELSDAMLAAYRGSNARLAEALGVDLAGHGYFPDLPAASGGPGDEG